MYAFHISWTVSCFTYFMSFIYVKNKTEQRSLRQAAWGRRQSEASGVMGSEASGEVARFRGREEKERGFIEPCYCQGFLWGDDFEAQQLM